ncbi:MAG: lipid-A-disaccharide synthase [Phycisphaerales bacterium]|nr:lipid-A-disaccharide synthase [Phycisphaerales bacterium]
MGGTAVATQGPASGTATDAATPRPTLLFTAFEPSGDDHAAPVIAELLRRHPGLKIYAWGGPKMASAGAIIVERTGDAAVMGMPGLAKLLEHKRINKRIGAWLDANRVTVHVPVDSPAANFPICKLSKARGIKVVHLVAPQMWAWGQWRLKKLRRLTDLVLALLPFEEDWFLTRGVKAKFVGHPLFDHVLDLEQLETQAAGLGGGNPKIAMMPGSRPAEYLASFPVLLDALRRLRADFPDTRAVVAVTREEVAEQLRQIAAQQGGWPDELRIVIGNADAVVRWCDFALVASGTVTLQVARQHKPMVTFYRPSKLMYHLAYRWLVSTPFYTLPNLIAGKKIVPELIPHFGDGEALAVAIIRLMRQPGAAEDQRAELVKVIKRFEGKCAGTAAADEIEKMVGLV